MTDWKLIIKKIIIAVYRVFEPILTRLNFNAKEFYELSYWVVRKISEKELSNTFYSRIFTEYVELTEEFYVDKKMLDVGCGPRGSLEWASMLKERVGLDTLVNEYRRLGIEKHNMTYVDAPAESIPYPDGYFDVVSTVNSLDHVDNVDEATNEFMRVTSQGGQLIIIVEIATKPTIAEPHTIPWTLSQKFQPTFEILLEKHLEQHPTKRGLSPAVIQNIPFNHEDKTPRDGYLILRMKKR